MALRVTFAGGAGTVTGSNFLVKGDEGTLLIDCGIEQGKDFSVDEMYAPFSYDVSSVDALIITHAHLDHIGRAPKLMREGFRGSVYMTEATRDLTELMLRDSVAIMAMDAARIEREPLFNDADITAFMAQVKTIPYHEEVAVAPGLSIYLRHTGHVLGSASVRVKANDGTTVAFTGDLGNTPNPYLPDWEPIPDADALIMESVYGDRLHPHLDTRTEGLKDALTRALAKGGTMLMPAFSLERTQLMLYELSNLFAEGALPEFPVYLDSPLAIHVTDVYEKHAGEFFNREAKEETKREHSIFRFPFLTMTLSREESQSIDKVHGPKLIIAGAGMSHGGRIGRWEAKYLPDPATTLFSVGYQAPGSPGRRLQDGAPHVKLDGKDISVRAKVETLSAWSAHADRDGLLKFAEGALPRAKTIFVAIGEPASERFLAQRVHDYLGANATVPIPGETWLITKDGATKEH